MNGKSKQKVDWQQCPNGAISNLVKNKKAVVRRDVVGKVVSTAVLLFAFAAVGTLFFPKATNDASPAMSPAEYRVGTTNVQHISKLRCCKVEELMAEYVAGKVNCSKLKRKIDIHITHCHSCRKSFQDH